jgi:hypothetical protein
MSFAMIVYLIGMLGAVNDAISLLFGLSSIIVMGAGLFALFLASEDLYESPMQKTLAVIKTASVVAVSLLVLSIFIPSKETAYTMIAASGVETIVTDDRVQQLGGKSLDVIEQWLEEMSPEKEGE